MGTLSSELSTHVGRITRQPRLYVDANMPARLVSLMRNELKWDVLFVIEHDDLRRATDDAHFRLARQLVRTLVTLDHDYLDHRRFPPGESAGVLVLTAPDERGLALLLRRLDRDIFRKAGSAPEGAALPFEGHTLLLHPDWRARDAGPA